MYAVKDEVALITRAASGIGAKVDCWLYEKGAEVILIDLDTTQLNKISGRLGEDRVRGVVADVRVTGPRELVHGERESFVGGYRWQRSGLRVGSPGLHVGGGGT
jgi:NADP-dependent 3-hydroxy acid dehydrogenase YdfG